MTQLAAPATCFSDDLATARAAPFGPTTHHLPATPGTCFWGYLDQAQEPVLQVRSGEVVEVEALTHHAGDAPDLLMDEGVRAVWRAIPERERGPGVHILTGPIEVQGAEPRARRILARARSSLGPPWRMSSLIAMRRSSSSS